MDAIVKFFQGLDIGVISLFIALISIFFGIIAITFIIINIKALRRQNENTTKSERNERFKNAIEQLGNDKNAIILGGIYTLHRIAKEDKDYIENIFNILCAFVRDTTTTKDYQKNYNEKPSEPIQTILNILCKNETDLKVYRTPESKLTIDFSGAYLRNVRLNTSNLINADLAYTNFTGAFLSHSNLAGAYLLDSNLTRTLLHHTNLIGAYLSYSTLTSTYLHHSYLTGAFLGNANLTDTDLDSANLTGAYSSQDIVYDPFEECIKSRTDKETDLSGIAGGYDPKNPPFKGTPIFGSYTKEDADEIIKKYTKNKNTDNF